MPAPTSTVAHDGESEIKISSNPAVDLVHQDALQKTSEVREDVGSPTSPSSTWFAFGSPAALVANDESVPDPNQSPDTPTSFLGYFFGGGGESQVELPPHDVPVTSVPVPVEPVPPDEIPAEEPGFGSFLWTLVAGEEGYDDGQQGASDDAGISSVPQIQEEQPRQEAPQPAYTAKKPDRSKQGMFTDSDAEALVDRIEQGGGTMETNSGQTSRKSIISDMEIKMKLNEAKTSLKKLKEVQKETNELLGIKGPSSGGAPKSAASTTTVAQEVVDAKPVGPPRQTAGRKFVPRNTQTHMPYRAKMSFDALNGPVSDRIKTFPASTGSLLHARQPMPVNLSGHFPRDVIVVASVEARSLRQQI